MNTVCWIIRASIKFVVVRFRCFSRYLGLALWLVVISSTSVATASAADRWDALQLLGREIAPGTRSKFPFIPDRSFEASYLNMPVFVARGMQQGPTLCLTAGVHGDELNGVEVARRAFAKVDPQELRGTLIALPTINAEGVRTGSRYLSDRRDLNRYFPGNPNGSAAARIAHSFFLNVVAHCDAMIDLHTGSNDRANLPQIRADLRDPDVVTLTQGFGSMVILHSTPAVGTLRYAATRAGIPSVTLEAGGPSQLELNEVRHGVRGIETLLNTLGMIKKRNLWRDPEPVYYRSSWVRADNGGILLADVSLGSTVRKGDLLGTINDPMSNARSELRSPYSGRIIGMARNQVVMPGFAAFHVGIQTADAPTEVADDAVLSQKQSENRDYIDDMSEEE